MKAMSGNQSMTWRHQPVLVLVALISGLALGGNASAQVRPAYVKNVDEPGRMPYQSVQTFSGSSASCPVPSSCVIPFDAVPAGKRLVVEQVTILAATTGGAPYMVALGDFFVTNSNNIAIITPDFRPGLGVLGNTFYSLNQQVRAFYEAGSTPKLKLFSPSPFGIPGNATIQGYLIDAAN